MLKKILIAVSFVLSSKLLLAQGVLVPIERIPEISPIPFPGMSFQNVEVKIESQLATVSLEQAFVNNFHREIEATYIFPIPEDASLHKFSMFVGGEEIQGEILDRKEARRIYDEIVRRKKDPGILEYYNQGLWKASVYPVPAYGEVRIKLAYSQMLKKENKTNEFKFNLGCSKAGEPKRLNFSLNLKSNQELQNIYSPSHEIKITELHPREVRITADFERFQPEKDFLLYWGEGGEDLGFDFMTAEDEKGQNYFIALLSPQMKNIKNITAKNVIFIVDISGSMQGDKIRQAKEGLLYCLSSLNPSDKFGIISFSSNVEQFSDSLLRVNTFNLSRAKIFVNELEAEGGTHIHRALMSGLNLIEGSRPNFVIFLTDGLPTVGITDINRILADVKNRNTGKGRIFVFGVGYDVNTVFLDRLSGDNSAVSEYVTPSENLEEKISRLYSKINHPVLTDARIEFSGAHIKEVFPPGSYDLFAGSQLVVTGKFTGRGSGYIILKGKIADNEKSFVYPVTFNPGARKSFIPKLWATKKIAYLIDQIRFSGEHSEIIEEIVNLSKRYGIITPYTSFFVDVDYRRAEESDIYSRAKEELSANSQDVTGEKAVRAAEALRYQKGITQVGVSAPATLFKNGSITQAIQNVEDKVFYLQNGFWIDSQYDKNLKKLQIKKFSRAYFQLTDSFPEIGKYLSLGENIMLVMGKTVIEIGEAGKEELTSSDLKF